MKHLFTVLMAAFATTSALANFVGMEYETVAETANGTTYRVYATFDNPTDELVAVYALETAPMVVGVSTSFYQDPVGAVLAQTISTSIRLFWVTAAGSTTTLAMPSSAVSW